MHIRRRIRHDQRGQTATELALVLPVFCLLLFGVIQFGIVFHDYVTLTDAVRAGARKGAVSRYEANPGGATADAVRRAAAGLDQAKLDVRVAATAWQHGADVTVEATYPYEINLLGWVARSGRLRSTTTERVE
jgi:Flp pilus assembly protein TadG